MVAGFRLGRILRRHLCFVAARAAQQRGSVEASIVTANELLQRIRDVACRKPDVIPAGWLSAKQWAVVWKANVPAVRRSLSIGVRGGVVIKKRFLVRSRNNTVLVSFFRAVEKKRGE